MSNEVEKSNVIENISETLEKYLEVKDILIENDITEALSDSFSLLKLLKNANSLIAKKKFQHFLKGFNVENRPSDYQLAKLHKYIDNTVKAEFIADMFSKILLSNSKLSCAILGSISQKLIENNQDISHEDLICAEAITKFFDYDIRNFKIICDYHRIKKRKDSRYFKLDYIFSKYCKDNIKTNYESVNLTLEKSISYQLIFKENEVDLNVDEDNIDMSSADTTEWCYITNPGEQMYKYILNLNL